MLTVVFALLGLMTQSSAMYEAIGNGMLPCPDLYPQPNLNVEQLLGEWHLSLLVVDATDEELVESGVCISGEIMQHNQSTLRQLWTVQATGESDPVAHLDLPTTLVRSGIWTVHSPLGGKLKATVFESEPLSYILISNCGLHRGIMVHLWTAAITRARIISPKLRHYLTSALEDHGFHATHNKIISWHGC